MKLERARTDALAILAAALRSVDPVARVEAALRAEPPVGPVVVVGAGKAAAGMAAGAVRALGPQVVGGLRGAARRRHRRAPARDPGRAG
jgi:glycerate-2-kinase